MIARVLLVLVFASVLCGSLVAQDKTVIHDDKARRMLQGRHKLSLQWISWDYFGSATVTNRRGTYYLKGEQKGRGKTDFVKVDGIVTQIDTKEFSFDGTITTQVSHINGGKPCERTGTMTFRITGKRKYWRMQQIDNPCDQAADYVDIYFR
jgi:hypothetical protein